MGERAERLWVGEPGRLSPDESERFKEERLRLVWSRLDCLVIFLNKELRFFLKKTKERIYVEEKNKSIKTIMMMYSCFPIFYILIIF